MEESSPGAESCIDTSQKGERDWHVSNCKWVRMVGIECIVRMAREASGGMSSLGWEKTSSTMCPR